MFKEFGSDKDSVHSYDMVYQRLLGKYVGKGASLLELGTSDGSSMRAWKAYLVNGNITGVDRNKPSKIGVYDFIQADVTTKEFVDKIGSRMFDIIIDDASHILSDQLTAARVLLSHLNKGGIYVIEDISPFENWEKFKEFGEIELIDNRKVKNQYNDVLVVIKKEV